MTASSLYMRYHGEEYTVFFDPRVHNCILLPNRVFLEPEHLKNGGRSTKKLVVMGYGVKYLSLENLACSLKAAIAELVSSETLLQIAHAT